MKDIVERVNELRNYNNLSGRAFAAKIGMKYTTVNNYLNGTKDPTLDFIMHIKSTFIDISYDWLLNGVGSMFKEDKPNDEALLKELAEMKVKLLVQEGITKELRDMLLEKNNGKIAEERKSLVG